jgi:hypothetical protein
MKEEKHKAAEEIRRAEEEIASGAYFECGCCFGDTGLSMLGELASLLNTRVCVKLTLSSSLKVTCSEGCQFCQECALANANSQIGMRKFVRPRLSLTSPLASMPSSDIAPFAGPPLHVDRRLQVDFPRVGSDQVPPPFESCRAAQDQTGEGGRSRGTCRTREVSVLPVRVHYRERPGAAAEVSEGGLRYRLMSTVQEGESRLVGVRGGLLINMLIARAGGSPAEDMRRNGPRQENRRYSHGRRFVLPPSSPLALATPSLKFGTSHSTRGHDGRSGS